MPEWSNGAGLGPVSLVLTRVQTPSPAFFYKKDFCKKFNLEIENLDHSSETIDSYRSRFTSALKTLTEKLLVQQKNVQQFKQHIEQKINQIHIDIKEGYVSKANNSSSL